jgi:predicted permease
MGGALMKRTVLGRLLTLFRRRDAETRLDDEVRAHLELLEADYVRRGMAADEARFAARRAFGGVEQMKERHRERRGFAWLDDVARDLHYAARSLRRSPGFAIACASILTLGIGLNLALFQLVNVTTLQPLPVKDPDTLARFYRLDGAGSGSLVPYAAARFIQEHQRVLSAVLSQAFMDVPWQGDPADSIRVAYVSANWFRELGYGAAQGRSFRESVDEQPGASPVVVLSHAFWRARLGGNHAAVGSSVRIGDRLATVIGIAPPEFPGLRLRDVQVWIPIAQIDLFMPGTDFKTTWRSNTEVYGRLRPGIGTAAARDGLRSAVSELARQHPDAFRAGEWLEPYTAAVRFETPRERRQRLTIVLAGAALTVLVLLIGCANLSNLVLSRGGERLREVSIRTALGASRWRVMRQLMTETLALAMLGAAGGLSVGAAGAGAIAAVVELPPFLDFSPDWRMFAAAVAAALVSMVVIGLYPAWKVSRHGLAESIRDGGQQASSGLERARFRQALIAAQLGGTCLLLVLAGATLQNLQRALFSDPGFDFANVAVLDTSIARHGVTGPAAAAYWSTVKASVAALPEAESVALVSQAPLGRDSTMSIYPGIGSLQVTVTKVDPDFFGLMKIPLLAGRNFTRADDPAATVIVSRRLALAMYGSLAIVGRSFPVIPAQYAARWTGVARRTIVGVADDARLIRITASDGAEQYWPIDPSAPGSVALLARARTDAARLLAPMRDAARAADSRVLAQARAMTDDFDTRMFPLRVGSTVATALAVLALSLACVGAFSMVSYGVARRTKELGIRLTLGAPRTALIRMLLAQLLWPTAIGLLAGAAAAVPAAGLLRGDPFFLLASFDAGVHAWVIAVLVATVGVAALSPALRALRMNPVNALRVE